MVHFLFSFLTLCLCFQYFHNDLLLFNKESTLDPRKENTNSPSDFSYLPVADTLSTHGTTIGSADVFLRFRQPHENFRSHSTNLHKENSAWAHTTCGFWCFPNLLGVKVNNSITRGSGPRSDRTDSSSAFRRINDYTCIKFCKYLQPGFVRGCIVGQPTAVCQTLHHPECLNR
ncbi:hypothetical protein G4228_011556 [Cervus hanglu yarkandensis]|nr:hypothetical protein G4228_011556 [Cervus hanglu yarkandensis]